MGEDSGSPERLSMLDEVTIGSSLHKEDEEMEGDHSYETKVHCSFNMKKVAEAFSCIGVEKEKIIESMGFGGLLKLPQQQQSTPCFVNRQFSFWLMLHVDVGASEIKLGSRGSIPLNERDVNRVLGIPWKGKKIEPSDQGGVDRAKKIIRKYLLLKDSDALDLSTIRSVVKQECPEEMNEEQKRCFAVAAVIYATSYFLAPKSRIAKINNEVLPYLVDYKDICNVNWSDYVLRVLLESCSKVQSDNCLGQASLTLEGCLLVLQILYLDNLDYGTARTRQYILPRILDFRYDVIRFMIHQDTNSSSTDEGLKFGRLELRHLFETIYTRGDRYRSVDDKIQHNTATLSKEDDVGVMVDFLKYFIDNEKKTIRTQAAESVEKACNSMDKCLQNLIARYEGWFEKRKKKRAEKLPDEIMCPTPLEVIKQNKWETCQGEASKKNDEDVVGPTEICGGEEGVAVRTMGRRKRMAFKSTGGKKRQNVGDGNKSEGAASKDMDMVDG